MRFVRGSLSRSLSVVKLDLPSSEFFLRILFNSVNTFYGLANF